MNCPVCHKPALPGYATCGNSDCQEINTLKQLARNARGMKKEWFISEIQHFESERETYDMITRKAAGA